MKRTYVLFISSILLLNISSYSQGKVEIEGAVKIGNTEDPTPEPGTIRFNPVSNDFEGWSGQWMSLTGSTGPTGSGMVTDIDGNKYLTVTIGTQTWMRESLRTSRYRNGDTITEVLLNSEWTGLSEGAWSWYAHDPEKDTPYGKLYNWYAVDDARGLCPTGWHVASDVEWTDMTTFLGSETVAGGKMKTIGTIEAGTGYWKDPNTGATNESGFTGLPNGYRSTTGSFNAVGDEGYWWSSTESGASNAWWRVLYFDDAMVFRFDDDKRFGFSVRCVKD